MIRHCHEFARLISRRIEESEAMILQQIYVVKKTMWLSGLNSKGLQSARLFGIIKETYVREM